MFKEGVRIFSNLFIDENPKLAETRDVFRQHWIDFLSPFYKYVTIDGIVTPSVFTTHSAFIDANIQTTVTGQAAKRRRVETDMRKNMSVKSTTQLDNIVNRMVMHMAIEGTIFPVRHPDVFFNLFFKPNIEIFRGTDKVGGEEGRNNLHEVLWLNTWKNDRMPYTYEEVVRKDTLQEIYLEWTQEDVHCVGLDRIGRAQRDMDYYCRMLCKFKRCNMVEACLKCNDGYGEAYPTRWLADTTFWIAGVWVNFFCNNSQLGKETDNWSLHCQTGNIADIRPLSRGILKRLSGKTGFTSGSHIRIKEIGKALDLKLHSFGIMGDTVVVRPIASEWGPFTIIVNMMAEFGFSEFKPSDSQLQLIKDRLGVMNINEQDKSDYDKLISGSVEHLLTSINAILDDPKLMGKEEKKGIVYFRLFEMVMSEDGFNIMSKEEFEESCACITRDWPKEEESIATRRRFRVRSREEIGAVTPQHGIIEVNANPHVLSDAEKLEIKQKEEETRLLQEQIAANKRRADALFSFKFKSKQSEESPNFELEPSQSSDLETASLSFQDSLDDLPN